ncbi:7-dehydrocholesterol reductase [Sphaceloma murrayae]|uniref:7-dehydrocholesterol reductase n=1 Tax=Sphaceloma murrayae TaxID=2082308 RepID=A0A2K1QZG1_9PEZI|nr:7-dehydrocholesterol reductase [Sphaceloma murrayae]
MVVRVLDDYYLAITFLITVAYQLFFFSIAWTLKFDKLTDFAGGTNFAVLAIITLSFSQTTEPRQIIASIFIILWALRLSGFLLFRILKTGKDDRFDDKRDKFFPFLGFWVFQMFWVWTVSLPVTLLNSPNVTRFIQPRFGRGSDIAGVIFFVIGFLMEAMADIEKYRFKMRHKGPKEICDKGFWGFSRHPNYAGEILVQFAIYMVCVTPAGSGFVTGGARAALYASIVGPLFLTLLLMFVSGLTLQERPAAKKKYEKGEGWHEYAAYLHRTSMLIPFPPQIYSRLPVWVKRTIFLEFPIYVFDPAKHADQSKVQQRESEEGLSSGAEGERHAEA